MGLRPYGTADSANDFLVNAIDVHAFLYPDLLEDMERFVEDLEFALERMNRKGHLQEALSDAETRRPPTVHPPASGS